MFIVFVVTVYILPISSFDKVVYPLLRDNEKREKDFLRL
jgi:hypothetical protein